MEAVSVYIIFLLAIDDIINATTELTTECACPGDILTYECTFTGVPGGATVWRGTAFDCSLHEISLLIVVLLMGHLVYAMMEM